LGRINAGDTKTVKYEFTVPVDMKEASYTVIAKAYNKNAGESKDCADSFASGLSQSVDVQLENTDSKMITFDSLDITPSQATCGDSVTLTFNTDNIGDTNQDRIKVNLYGSELKLSQSQEITNGLDSGESQAMVFTFNVPQSLTNKIYPITISADYSYNSNGVYRLVNTGQTQTISLNVIGCAQASQSTIAASLTTSAEVGKEMDVQVTVTNAGSSADFTINPIGYESWATTASVDPILSNIPSGVSKQFTVKLTPTQAGTQTFTIQAIPSNGQATTKQVQVTVANTQSFFSQFSSLGNTTLFIIAAVLIILIIVIIVLIARMSSRKKPEY
jgi:hypothetical protein